MERLSFFVGIGLAVVGFGLEVSGITNLPLGIGIMILGVIIMFFSGATYLVKWRRSRVIVNPAKRQYENNEHMPTALKEFSSHVDELMRGKNLSGLGVIFLNKIRIAPPFLGIEHSQYVLSPNLERVFTEHFSAKELKKANEGIFRGGKTYIGRHGDTPKSVAKKIYGNVKFASKVPYFTFSNGSYYKLPFIDTNESRSLSSEKIADIYSKADENCIKEAIKEMANQFNVPEDEMSWLIETIYKVAQMTKSRRT